MDWIDREHVYIAQWVTPVATISAMLFLIFLPRYLEWRNRPRIRAEFMNMQPFVRTTEVQDDVTVLWRRVKVTNVGGRPVRRCIGMVTNVTTYGAPRNDIDAMQLRWAGVPRSRGFEAINLGRGDFSFLDVLSQRSDEAVAKFETFIAEDFDPGFKTWLDVGSGENLISVTVTSDTADPATIVIKIRV